MKSEMPLDPEPSLLDGTVGKLAYVEAGTEGPCVLLVHGCPGSRRDFRWWMYALSQWAHVVAVDMPGFGDARPTGFPATMGAQAAYLAEVLDKVGVRKTFVVGHSFGASAVVNLAVRYSERVHGLGLIAPAGAIMHQGLKRFKGRSLLHALAHVPGVGERALDALKSGMVRVGFSRDLETDEIIRMLDLLARFDFGDYAELLSQVRCPAFVSHATDDPFIEYWIVEDLVKRLGKPRFHILSEGGHNIQKTMAVELNEALRAWILDEVI